MTYNEGVFVSIYQDVTICEARGRIHAAATVSHGREIPYTLVGSGNGVLGT